MISNTFTKPWKQNKKKINFSSKFMLSKKQSSVPEENCVVFVENFF